MSRRLTDEEIAARYSNQYRVETPEAGLTELGGSAIDRLQAKAYGLVEPLGLSRDYRLAQEAEAERTSQRYYDTNQGAVGSYKNISGIGDVGRYAAELGVQSLPEIVPVVGAGIVGGPAAAFGVAGALGIGEVMQAQRAQAGRTDLTAIPLGLAYGGAEAATGIVGKLAGTGIRAERAAAVANRYLDNLGGFTGGAARTGAAAGRTGFSEAVGEVGQEYISNVGRLAVDPRVDLFSPEALNDYAESFVGGGLLGGLLGGAAGGWRRSQGFREAARERDLTSSMAEEEAPLQRPLESQFVTQDQTLGLQSFINQNVGITRPKRRDYVAQFKAAYDEPTGQFVNDPETGIERPLTVGEALQRSQAPLDMTQEKPADAAATAQVVASTVRDPRSYELRDTFGVIPTPSSLQLYSDIQASGLPVDSDLLVGVWAYAGEKPMTPKRLEKAQQLLDAAIIEARKEAPSGTGIPTVQQPAGSVGVGSPVVQGGMGDAGRPATVTGTVVGGAPAAGAPLQQAGVLPIAAGQPTTPVTTGAPSGPQAPQTIEAAPQGQTATTVPAAAPVSQPLAPGQFRRAPRPMTVLEAANAAKAQRAETQGQTAPAAAGPVVDERQVVLQQIFGQRNGDIIFDVVGMGMSEPEAATKYGLSRQAIQKIAGATGQKTWPERIARAKAEFGLTDAQIADAFNTVAPDSTEGQIASEVFTQSQERMDENQAIEAGLGNIVKTAGASTGAVEGFTDLQNEIDATLEALAAETDEAVLAQLNATLAAQIEKVKAVEKQAQAEVRALAGRKSQKDASDEAAAKAEQPKELGAEDAVQVESPAGVSVQPEAEAGQGVGKQVRRAKKPATEGKVAAPAVPAKILTEAEQAAQAWDVVVADYPQAPKFAELTKAQQQNFIEFGPGNWERGDVELELTKLARAAASTQRAIGNEPVTIDVEARVVEETVGPQVAKLPAPQVTRLENHYGVKQDSPEFLAKVKADVVLYATKGAEAVAGAIRDIIKAIHAGVLSVAMIFNPTAVSQIEAFVVIPQETQTTTQQVLAELPAEVQGMSEAGKQAYATLIPALKGKIGDKFVTIADKPSGRIFVFKANGDLVLQKKALFGLAKGDLYKGNNDLPQNRVTPAGLFGINVIDAAKGGAAATTAGDYDFGKVFALDDPDATVTFMHSVWLKESDAAKRAAALKNDSAADSRYSFGCINVDKETFKDMVGKYSANMDGSKLFVVPDAQSTVNDFLTGNVANDRLVREGVQPVTKTTTTPVKSATKTAGVDRTVAAKEEELPSVRFSKQSKKTATKNTVERIRTTMASAFKATFGNYPHEDFVRVHQTAEQAFLASGKKVPLAQLGNAQAFVDPVDQRVVHLIADNIPVGHEFAVLLHDVGVHVGLKGQLGALFKVLEAQVKSWSASPKNSMEFQVYEAAMARVAAGRLEGSIDPNDVNEELVAYAAEEAVARGVKPQAASNKKLERWLAQLKNVVERALKNFFKIDTVPNVSAQDLVNFSYAAASKQMQEYRREPGAAWRDNPTQVIRFYANRGSLPDNARLEKLGSPGEEFFYWGKSSTYAGFTDIGTAAELRAVQRPMAGSVPDVRVFSMVVTSTESRKLGTQTGFSEDKVLQSFEAVEDPKTKVWSLSVYGPTKDSALYNELWLDDKASTTKDVDGDEWTRLEGVGMRDNLRVLSEFRRRLTRAIGQVPYVDWTRVTASGTNMEGGEGRYNAVDPETLATRYSKVAPRRPQGLIDRNIAKLPKQSQQPVKNLTAALGDLGGKYLDYAVFTNDLVKRAQALGLTAAKTFSDRLAARNAKVSEEERKIEKIADGYALIEDANKGSGPGSVNEFLFESTRTGKWGYGKYRDAKMGAAFDALGPKAQQFVKDVFAHGDAMLSNKKRIVLNATSSEYDAMIKAAQDDGDTQTEAKLKAEKAATLKRFQTLFRIREGVPYAPIKRTGAYVVIGESDAYKAAKAKNDTATVKKLESDPDHYHVSFVDTKWQARNLSDKLSEQGVFTSPQIVKRSESFDEAFSGEAMLPALTKMRAAVDRRAQDANGKKDPSAGKLLNIINQLYLEALAEGSARKSEMRRRGVAGEVDMLQSFTQQGRADANFLASVEYEPKIQDALQQMRNQSRTGDRERKSEIFDELTKRYADSLEPKNNPFINGLTNMASKFFLASSPGYYLQNLTQPFMMSLPAMAGRHDYTKAAAELAKAYTELGPLFKDVKLFDQQFDFSKVPADVRAAINDLVNQGKIDIGLATEINEYKVDADGKLSQFAQRLNKGMRMAVQKVEATNRLSTAIAAYRLEYARTKDAAKATQYAADILTDTHGDYTAFNAPRAFNTQWGKVALQFRKFQLIQIAFYAKLFRDLGRTPEERAVAMKTLAYSLSHTAVFAGMMGIPGYAAVSAILGFFGDEDEPYDLTADMRKKIGPEWADMIMRGAPTVVGMDLSGKIGSGNMLSIMPFSDADLSTNAGRAEAFGTLMGGAALGMTSRVIDGLGLIASGDYYKGVERTMPKGVSDALKAGRQAAEGMTRRNGDVILPDSEIGAIDTVLTALGVPAVKQAVTYERQNRMRDITENFTDRTTRIKNDYAKAVREKDTEGMAEARAAWTKLQQARQRNGLKPQPVSNLLKAPQEQKAREQRTVGGVAYREGQKKLAESVAAN